MKIFRKKPEVQVTGCHVYESAYMFTLSGYIAPGCLMELHVMENGADILMAIVEVEHWGSDGSIIAYTIWLDREKFWGKPPELFVYPNVRVAPIHRRSIERYLVDEGKQGVTRILHADPHVYVAHRLGCRVAGNRDPWVCYLLNGVTGEHSIIANKTTLKDMKEFLIKLVPTKTSEIMEWGTEGCQVFNLLDYGARADGVHDDTDVLLRVYGMARRGDVIYIPNDRKIAVKPGIARPTEVIVDIRTEQFAELGKKKE